MLRRTVGEDDALLQLCGLRRDGRRVDEIRRLAVRLGVVSGTDGSVYLEQGLCKVLATVLGPHEVAHRGDADMQRSVLHCSYRPAPFARLERRKRRGGGDRAGREVELVVEETCGAVVLTDLYPRTQIDIVLHVLQSDGSELCACVNAAMLALMDAGIALRDFAVACSAGFVDEGSAMVDLTYKEQRSGAAFMSVAIMPHLEDRVLMAQMDAKLHLDQFESVLRAAIAGCHRVHSQLREAMQQYAVALHGVRTLTAGVAAAPWAPPDHQQAAEAAAPPPAPTSESKGVKKKHGGDGVQHVVDVEEEDDDSTVDGGS